MINLSFVIPVFNEEASIVELLNNIKIKVENVKEIEKFEIIVVDDNSTDNTSNLISDLKNIKYLKNLNNFGYGFSLKRGIKKSQYENIVILDGDGTYPIEHLDKLLEKYKEGFDLVIAKRIGKNLNLSTFKKPMRMLLKFIVEFATGSKIPDINSGYRIIKRDKIIDKLVNLSDAFSFTTSMTMSFIYSKHSIAYVDIPYALRSEGFPSKVRLFKDSLRTLQFIIKIVLLYDKIKLFVLITFLQTILAILFLLISIININFLLPGVFILISAIICFCLGLLSETFKK